MQCNTDKKSPCNRFSAWIVLIMAIVMLIAILTNYKL